MSESSDEQKSQILTAQYKDGQLQIVEVTPFDRDDPDGIAKLTCDGENEPKQYMQVIDGDKNLVQLDLLNLTLVRSQDGNESYQLITNASDGGEGSENAVTCVLQASDNEEHENQEYVMVDSDNGQGPLFFLQSSLPQVNTQVKKDDTEKVLTPAEILEKAKAIQKAKVSVTQSTPRRRGRKRKSDLPPAHELLNLPNFKLFLYSCKMCTFKCNAVKEMSEHKALVHGSSKGRSSGRFTAVTLQCARCPFLAQTHIQLAKHVEDSHSMTETVQLNTEEVEAADVLVCGACGFESSSKQHFRNHIEQDHGVATC